MCLFLNVSYCDMLLLAKLKNIIGNIKCLRKIYYNFDSTTLFSCGGETIMGQSKYPEILNDRTHEYMYTHTPWVVCS